MADPTASTSTAGSSTATLGVPQSRKLSLTKSTIKLQSKLEALKLHRRRASRVETGSKAEKEENEYNIHPIIGANKTSKLSSDAIRPAPRQDFGELFFSTPVELQLQIVGFADIFTAFALRATSKYLASLVHQSRHAIGQKYIAEEYPSSCKHLCRDPPFSLQYLYQIHHAHTISIKVANLLADFVESAILKDVGEKMGDQERTRFVALAVPSLLTLSHFYKTMLQWMLLYSPRTETNGWNIGDRTTGLNPSIAGQGQNQMNTDLFHSNAIILDAEAPVTSIRETTKKLMRQCYMPSQLESAHNMENFLTSTLRRLLRQASYLSFLERRPLPTQTVGNMPATENVELLLVIGGLDEARRVLSKKSFSSRVNEVNRWRKSLHKAECIDWLENWKTTLYGPFADSPTNELPENSKGSTVSCDFNPPASFSPPWIGLWYADAYWLLDEYGMQREPKSTRAFVSEMIGYDVLRGTRWA